MMIQRVLILQEEQETSSLCKLGRVTAACCNIRFLKTRPDSLLRDIGAVPDMAAVLQR
jgi:hypothetical protein